MCTGRQPSTVSHLSFPVNPTGDEQLLTRLNPPVNYDQSWPDWRFMRHVKARNRTPTRSMRTNTLPTIVQPCGRRCEERSREWIDLILSKRLTQAMTWPFIASKALNSDCYSFFDCNNFVKSRDGTAPRFPPKSFISHVTVTASSRKHKTMSHHLHVHRHQISENQKINDSMPGTTWYTCI